MGEAAVAADTPKYNVSMVTNSEVTASKGSGQTDGDIDHIPGEEDEVDEETGTRRDNIREEQTEEIQEDLEEVEVLETIADVPILGEDYSDVRDNEGVVTKQPQDDFEAKLQKEGDEVIIEDVPILDGQGSEDNQTPFQEEGPVRGHSVDAGNDYGESLTFDVNEKRGGEESYADGVRNDVS